MFDDKVLNAPLTMLATFKITNKDQDEDEEYKT